MSDPPVTTGDGGKVVEVEIEDEGEECGPLFASSGQSDGSDSMPASNKEAEDEARRRHRQEMTARISKPCMTENA